MLKHHIALNSFLCYGDRTDCFFAPFIFVRTQNRFINYIRKEMALKTFRFVDFHAKSHVRPQNTLTCIRFTIKIGNFHRCNCWVHAGMMHRRRRRTRWRRYQQMWEKKKIPRDEKGINFLHRKYRADEKGNNFRIEFIFSGVEELNGRAAPKRYGNKLVAGVCVCVPSVRWIYFPMPFSFFLSFFLCFFFLLSDRLVCVLRCLLPYNIWITIGNCVVELA